MTDDEKIAKAKELARGHLGKSITAFALPFAQPILIGGDPAASQVVLNNGTASLIQFGAQRVAVTCAHVLQAYYERRRTDPTVQIQIGNVRVDPEDIIDQDSRLDIATISIPETKMRNPSVRGGAFDFHVPVKWPPDPVAVGDLVTMAGYPGIWRVPPQHTAVEWDTLSIGHTPVTSISEDYFVCQLEREYWVMSLGPDSHLDIDDFGGLSGGPVFVMRKLHWEFAGIIYEWSRDFDLIYVRSSAVIDSSGTIVS